ncbi:hypothetical protein [Halopseudomonas sp.]|uniref:hypothetical protein n=1 Tax=Halopseudomonas sp. TaxID=2901191 RepID=UPI003562D90B
MRRAVLFLASVLLPWNAPAQTFQDDGQAHLYLADPLADRAQADQAPQLIWEAAQPVDPLGRKGRVALDAGATANYEFPPQAYLRLQLEDDMVPPSLWVSRDGALWEEALWTPGNAEHEWFYVQPDASPRLARLDAETAVRGRLLVADMDTVDTPERYQPLALGGRLEEVELVDEQGERLAAHRLDSDAYYLGDIQGPVVLALLSRPAQASEQAQSYALGWTLDDAPWQLLTVQRSQLSTHYHTVDGVALHGGMDRHYLTIPPGQHRLGVKASVPLYLQVEEAKEDYFLDFNEPAPTTVELTRELAADPVETAGMLLAEVEALSQSNHIEGAADIALDYLEQPVTASPEAQLPGTSVPPVMRALASNIERTQRFYRSLLPGAGTRPMALHSAWFASTTTPELDAGERYYLGDDVLQRLGRGQFVEVGQTPVAYPLPRRYGPSHLRIAAARLSPSAVAELHIQYDDTPPQRLRLTDSAYATGFTSPEDAQLSMAARPGEPTVPPTLSGQFATQRPIGHYWSVATITLPLPADVDQVRLWSDSAVPVPLALQYRASQPYEAGESVYQALLQQMPAGTLTERLHQALEDAPHSEEQPLSPRPTPQQALENQWYPLLRYLHASQTAYLDDFSPEPPAMPVEGLSQRVQKARTQAEQADWVAVLETLGSSGYGQDPQAYRLSQKALVALGEHYLAGRQRQAAAVFATDRNVRELATGELLADYADTQRWESQISLLAARFLREGDDRLIEPLARALHRAGDALWASQLGLLLAGEQGRPDWLAEAAQAAGWLHSAGSASADTLEKGDLAVRRGATAQALEHWRAAGERGQARITHLQKAADIARQLASPDRIRRLDGIERWLAWSVAPEQTFDWVSADDRIEASTGFSTLFSEVTRKPFAAPHATPDMPVELEVVGPAVLRVRLRRLAPDAPQAGAVDWLVAELADVEGETSKRHAPILSRAKSLYLSRVDQQAGVAAGDDILLNVPPGLHLVRLRPKEDDYLVQVWQWQPDHAWPVLPPVTPLALKDLLLGQHGRAAYRAVPTPMVRQIAPGQSRPLVPLVLQNLPSTPRFLSVRDGKVEPLAPESGPRLHTHDLVSLPVRALHSLLGPLQFPVESPAPDAWPVGSYAVDLESVIAEADVPQTPRAAYDLAAALLWQLEQKPLLMSQVGARVARLADAHGDATALRQMADRLLEKQDWEYISTSFESVGVRQLPLHSQMHSPFRRVREALLPTLSASRLLLSGRSIEGVELFTPAPLAIDVRLEQHALPHEKRLPIEVIIQVDDREPRRVNLAEGETVERIHLDPGEHVLTLALSEPRQQQYVTARVDRTGSSEPLLEEETRTYHIAAPEQPANFYVKGPAWVRVDEWTPGKGTTSYRYVGSGWQIITLKGGVNQDRYYRLYALREVPDAQLLEPRAIKADLAAPAREAPRASKPLTPTPEPVAWSAQDRHRPGSGLDSWGAYLGFTERAAGSEEDVLPSQGGGIVEAGFSYRFRLQDSRFFSRSDLLVRRFDSGEDVLGARQWLDFYPADGRWQVGLFAEAYLQPGEISELDGDDHWAARFRGSLERTYQLSPRLRHKPGISLNQRWLSLDSVPSQALPALDPDVFSPYKRDHLRSLLLSDRLTWTPNWDQKVYVDGALVSNESLNPFDPDYLQVTTAVQQLFGPVAGEAGLRWRSYFQDDDRSSRLDREQLFIRGDLLRWDAGANALTLSAETLYDIDRGDFGWALRIGYEANAGRMSPARRPDELDFLPLRRAQQRDHVESNSLEPIYP